MRITRPCFMIGFQFTVGSPDGYQRQKASEEQHPIPGMQAVAVVVAEVAVVAVVAVVAEVANVNMVI